MSVNSHHSATQSTTSSSEHNITESRTTFSQLLHKFTSSPADEPPNPTLNHAPIINECALKSDNRRSQLCANHECSGYNLIRGSTHIKAELCACVLHCPECLGAGFRHDKATAQSSYCVDITPKKLVALYNTSELPLRYLKAHFDSSEHGFRNFSGNGDQVLAQLHDYLNTFPAKHLKPRNTATINNPGLVLSGPVGVGKTHLLVCLAKNLIEKGYNVKFVDFFRISSEIQAGLTKKQSALEILDPLIAVDILLIDELGKGRNSQFELTIIDQIIMGRYNQAKPTIATTNYQLSSATPVNVNLRSSTDAFSSDDFGSLSERLGSRIFSRLKESTRFIELQGKDYRTMIQAQDSPRVSL